MPRQCDQLEITTAQQLLCLICSETSTWGKVPELSSLVGRLQSSSQAINRYGLCSLANSLAPPSCAPYNKRPAGDFLSGRLCRCPEASRSDRIRYSTCRYRPRPHRTRPQWIGLWVSRCSSSHGGHTKSAVTPSYCTVRTGTTYSVLRCPARLLSRSDRNCEPIVERHSPTIHARFAGRLHTERGSPPNHRLGLTPTQPMWLSMATQSPLSALGSDTPALSSTLSGSPYAPCISHRSRARREHRARSRGDIS